MHWNDPPLPLDSNNMHPLTPYPITPIGNFVGVVLALLPLLSNIRKLSLGVWGYAIWIAIYDFMFFVDTIIWHNNENIVAPVWCDITTKLQLGSQIGTRTCTLVICIHLYNVTRLHGNVEKTKRQKLKSSMLELSLIIGLPIVVMALWIVVQPIRFDIYEELGCQNTNYSYVGYILNYAPALITNIACLILAPFILRTFLRHRKEMNEFLSSERDMTHNKYYRLIVIAYLDTLFNLPVLVVSLATDIAGGKENPLNYSYTGWKNVHDGAGGNEPGLSLSSILQTPASAWSANKWGVFIVKWNEWIYVLHAVMFFCVFGTTPEMRSYYRAAFWFIPERLGYKRKNLVLETETVSDLAFNSNPRRDAAGGQAANRRRGSLSFLESAVDSASATRSGAASGLGETSTRFGIETITIEEGNDSEQREGRRE